ncbi:hypothetical protein BP5796_11189 [Coleophoma crateriformis]|uniref:Fe2OG dioxygenase domain-containing protein n=1 Tax=Coleophoma crateriformis TaxID=565419 RepID=A0A3D8QHT5_9HELO|nr:hypothetical protein BP5796_11189 [Coleophoma crateriformis]
MAPSKKHSSSKQPLNKSKPQVEAIAPDWPAFKPLLTTADLSLESVSKSQIVVIRNFWTSSLCKNYVTFLKTLPLVTTPGKPKKGEALRVNDRFQIDDPVFANRLWIETGLRELVCGGGEAGDIEDEDFMSPEERIRLWGGEVVGLNPSIRIYRYTKGQYFDKHYDESNVLGLPTKPTATPVKTTWTILLYLTSPATGCQGGETVFYPDDLPQKSSPIDKEIVVSLETGMLLLHKHGNDCMLHEGREVTDGEKWVIRTDLCYAPGAVQLVGDLDCDGLWLDFDERGRSWSIDFANLDGHMKEPETISYVVASRLSQGLLT